MPNTNTDVVAQLAYLVAGDSRAQHLIYPPNCGRALVRPAQEYHAMPIVDCRQLSPVATVDSAGFELLHAPSAVADHLLCDEGREWKGHLLAIGGAEGRLPFPVQFRRRINLVDRPLLEFDGVKAVFHRLVDQLLGDV